ncbi:hypothetical protein ABEX78_20485 [Priestia megaterium]
MTRKSATELAEEYAKNLDFNQLEETARTLYEAADRSYRGPGSGIQIVKVKELIKFSIELGDSLEFKRATEYKLLDKSLEYTEKGRVLAEELVPEFESSLEKILSENIKLKGDFFIHYDYNSSTEELTYSIFYKDEIELKRYAYAIYALEKLLERTEMEPEALEILNRAKEELDELHYKS